MNRKTNFLYFIIIVLLLLNTATLAVMFMHGHPRGEEGPREVSRWLTEQLKLNREQQKKYEVLLNEHREKMEPVQKQDRYFHDRYFALLQGNNFDSTSVAALADSMSVSRKQIEQLTFYDFKKIRSICNAEQQKKFDEIILEVFHRMAHHPQGR